MASSLDDWQPVATDGANDWAPVTTPPTWGATALDAAKGAGKGLAEGALAIPGLPGDINSGISSLSAWLAKKIPGQDPAAIDAQTAAANASSLNVLPTTQRLSDLTGASSLPDATTPIGKSVQNVAQFLPGAALPGGEGSAAAKLVKLGLAPGLASEGAGAAADALGASPAVQSGARLAASLAAPSITGRLISPLQNPDAAHAANIAALRGEGVQPTAGQTVDSKPIQYLEATLGSNANATQQGQLNQAAINRISAPNRPPLGEGGSLVPGQGGTIDTMLRTIGGRFDALQGANRMQGDTQLGTDLQDVWHNYASLTNPSARAPIIEDTIHDLGNAIPANGGSLPGPAYQALRSRLSAASASSSDPTLSRALGGLAEGMDDAMERSIAQNNPTALGQWQQTRRDYRNALVVEKAAGAAGPTAARGDLTPANLASAAKQVYGKRVYLRGQDDFSNLTQPAAASLPALPDSGTAHRAAATAALAAAGGAGGYLLGQKFNPDGSGNDSPIAGLLLGEGGGGALAAGFLGRRALMNGPMQAYLRNQAMTRTPGLLSLPGALTATNGGRGLLSQ